MDSSFLDAKPGRITVTLLLMASALGCGTLSLRQAGGKLSRAGAIRIRWKPQALRSHHQHKEAPSYVSFRLRLRRQQYAACPSGAANSFTGCKPECRVNHQRYGPTFILGGFKLQRPDHLSPSLSPASLSPSEDFVLRVHFPLTIHFKRQHNAIALRIAEFRCCGFT